MNTDTSSQPFSQPAISAQSQEAADRIMFDFDLQVRQELLKQVLWPNLALMRAGNNTPWNQNGWLQALEGEALDTAIAASQTRLPFPVPHDCAAWYPSEADARDGRVFRFFRQRAWLHLTPLAAVTHLELTVAHAVHQDAIDTLRVWASGESLMLVQRISDDFGRTVLRYARSILAPFTGTIELHLSCPVVDIPAKLYPGSTDPRLLSLAVCEPVFCQIK
jgi:hypothetical protein